VVWGGFGFGELWWKELVKNFVVLDLRKEKRVPVGAVGGVRYRTVCVDVPTHLKLFSKASARGRNSCNQS